MALLLAVEVHDMGEIYFFLLRSNVGTRHRWVLASSTFSPMPRTSVVFLALLWVAGRSLLSGRWLFPTRYVSNGGVGGLILSEVLLLFLHRLVLLRAPWVYLVGAGGWLEQRLCLYIDSFLDGLFLGVQFPTSSIQLSPDRKFQAFPKVSDHDLLVWSGSRVKLLENRFQMLQVGCPVKDFL